MMETFSFVMTTGLLMINQDKENKRKSKWKEKIMLFFKDIGCLDLLKDQWDVRGFALPKAIQGGISRQSCLPRLRQRIRLADSAIWPMLLLC
jgi:hypothetical protein